MRCLLVSLGHEFSFVHALIFHKNMDTENLQKIFGSLYPDLPSKFMIYYSNFCPNWYRNINIVINDLPWSFDIIIVVFDNTSGNKIFHALISVITLFYQSFLTAPLLWNLCTEELGEEVLSVGQTKHCAQWRATSIFLTVNQYIFLNKSFVLWLQFPESLLLLLLLLF